MKKKRIKGIRKNRLSAKKLIITCIAILSIFILSDSYVRFFLPQYREIYDYDTRLIHRLIPGSSKVTIMSEKDGGATIPVQVNSFGFRGPEFDLQKTKNRIIVYGDSHIEAYFSREENTFPSKLRKYLANSSDIKMDGTEVINAGVTGYGPDQILLRMQDELPKYKPDITVVALCNNDFGDLMRNKIFFLENGTLAEHEHQFNPILKAMRKAFVYSPGIKFVYLKLIDFAAIFKKESSQEYFGMYYNYSIMLGKAECADYLIKNSSTVANPFGDHDDMDMAVDPNSFCTEYKKELMKSIMKEMTIAASATNTTLIFMFIPSRYEVDERLFAETVDTRIYPDYNRTYFSQTYRDLAHDINADYLDLHAPFAAQAKNGEKLFFQYDKDWHWNDLGEEYAAQLMAEKIWEERLLAK